MVSAIADSSSHAESQTLFCVTGIKSKRQHNSPNRAVPIDGATAIVGRAQNLKALPQHPNICTFADILKGPEKDLVFIVSEHSESTIEDTYLRTEEGRISDTELLRSITCQILGALSFLHSHGIVHGNLSASSVCVIEPSTTVRLTEWFLGYMSENGEDLDFPIGEPVYLAPERVVVPKVAMMNPKVDVWSLGILLSILYFGVSDFGFNSGMAIEDFFKALMEKTESGHSNLPIVERIQQDNLMDEGLKSFTLDCLIWDVRNRPTVETLCGHTFLAGLRIPREPLDGPTQLVGAPPRTPAKGMNGTTQTPQTLPSSQNQQGLSAWKQRLRQESGVSSAPGSGSSSPISVITDFTPLDGLNDLTPSQIFHLWKLALGGSADREITKLVLGDTRHNEPTPILQIPSYFPLNTSSEDFLSLLHAAMDNSPSLSFTKSSAVVEPATAIHEKVRGDRAPRKRELPLSLRERDVVYQLSRIRLFSRMLWEFPASEEELRNEARADIPPLLRGRVWAALLGVKDESRFVYEALDTHKETTTDRQLDLDIPRCHQYNELLASPAGHQKLRKVIKAWMLTEAKELVYWQGLDSVCAPFLTLNFHEEWVAFASLRQFMLALTHLTSFHDPELSSHLLGIGLTPELYAIPWFMTMFSHIFSLDKIFHLWDTYVTESGRNTGKAPRLVFPFTALSILSQLRDALLSGDFNHVISPNGFYIPKLIILKKCMVLFSDLPTIDMETCITATQGFFQYTPPSMLRHLLVATATPAKLLTVRGRALPSLEVRRGEMVGRVIWEECVEMGGLVVIDTRDSVRSGHFPSAMTVPSGNALDAQGMVALKLVLSQRGASTRAVVIVTDVGSSPSAIANALVKAGVARVVIVEVERTPREFSCICEPIVKGGMIRCIQ
ncbi:hypothetical protein BJ742DRAFT_734234 [Cladochytrium replicatum]|nr:hypothetical protein BJ742DRAFT_734234 [Cladochytrium replicatum]